ncbi:MAG: tRNA lysidine(34) synthetase TilS, partial [Chromatiales bacterium]|nr:tRNA lysidine(34) synthetase TilS [Chromatiales bacterium]
MSLTSHYLQQRLDRHQPYKRLLVAYSGGLDSAVLLHLAVQLEALQQLQILAVHINHGLQQAADKWGEHCARICNSLNIPYQQIALSVTKEIGQSLEAQAREARYAAFSQLMKPGDLLLTAHHLDDQAE